jgi:hypothetical protein
VVITIKSNNKSAQTKVSKSSFKAKFMMILMMMLAFVAPRKMKDNEEAQAAIVGVIITVALTIIVGIMLVGQFMTQSNATMDTGDLANDTAAQAAYSNVKSTTWGAMNLLAMYPWILAAVAIMGVVMLIAGKNRG